MYRGLRAQDIYDAFRGDTLYRLQHDFFMSKIRASNKDLYELLVSKKSIEEWTSEDYIRLTNIRIKKKEPELLFVQGRNIRNMYPSLYYQDITKRLSPSHMVILHKMQEESKEATLQYLNKYLDQAQLDRVMTTKADLLVTDYGPVSVCIDIFRWARVRDYPALEGMIIKRIYEDFINSYKGLHKLSNFVIKGRSIILDFVQFRNL